MKKCLFAASALILSLSALFAQPQGYHGTQSQGDDRFQQQPRNGERPAPPKKPSPEEIAKAQADMMQAEIGIDQKQYKKVYKLIKKDQEYRQSQAQSMGGTGGGPGMGGPGGGMPGGGPGMGGFGGGMPGGGPGMGGPGGGMPGGGPGMGGPGGGMPGGGPGMNGQGMRPGPEGMQVSEEYLEKQEKKLKKILTPEQYSTWRAKHPAEHNELPPLEFK